jgi:hypothetical protein
VTSPRQDIICTNLQPVTSRVTKIRRRRRKDENKKSKKKQTLKRR